MLLLAACTLAVAGIPALPAIRAVGVSRVPWSPLVEAVNFVRRSLASVRIVNWHPSGEGVVIFMPGLNGATLAQVRSPGAKPEKLLHLSRNTRRIKLNPDPRKNYLIYFEDTDGDEYHQLFFHNLQTARVHRLTDGKSRLAEQSSISAASSLPFWPERATAKRRSSVS